MCERLVVERGKMFVSEQRDENRNKIPWEGTLPMLSKLEFPEIRMTLLRSLRQ